MVKNGRLVVLSLSELLGLWADAFQYGLRHTVKLVIARGCKGICAGRSDKFLVATEVLI